MKQNNKKVLQQTDIRNKRINWLVQLNYYRGNEYPIVFNYESYITTICADSKVWIDNSNNELLASGNADSCTPNTSLLWNKTTKTRKLLQ